MPPPLEVFVDLTSDVEEPEDAAPEGQVGAPCEGGKLVKKEVKPEGGQPASLQISQTSSNQSDVIQGTVRSQDQLSNLSGCEIGRDDIASQLSMAFWDSRNRRGRRRRERHPTRRVDSGGGAEASMATSDESVSKRDYLDDDVHPDELVETASLSSVPEPTVVNKLRLPSRTLLEGRLTNAQLEVCLRAIAQHELRLPNGQRSGFFMGDGAGVGKGRQQAGIIFHNFLHGRTKALWLSVSADLIDDARRDIQDIGGAEFIKCHDLKDFKLSTPLQSIQQLQTGILFCTYSLLVSGNTQRSRIEQIIEWCGPDFDGVIALDECHRAKNLSKSGGSKAAFAVRELQERLPLGRVVYVSATGATEPEHLACLSRLGLWGSGLSKAQSAALPSCRLEIFAHHDTAFFNPEAFISDIKKGGVGAMELCAMHMKASGQYLARSLSFKGASFDIVRDELSVEFNSMYDASASLWVKIVKAVNSELESNSEGRSAKAAMWGAHQRFWAQICMAAKVDSTIRIAKEALQQGKCVVIGLQNTGESVASEEESLEEPSSSAEGILKNFLNNNCCGLSFGTRDALLTELQGIKLPNNPLDEIIHRLGGPKKVAEMTGRKHRYVFCNGRWEYIARHKDSGSADTINVAERKRFQAGKKLVAIISEAASTGISLQADLRALNQRRRVHISFQLPWSAEKAVQQMGRSHRSNQASAPEFKLVLSPIGGEWRFASAVANRLQSLGALTQGDRRAAGASAAMRTFSIEPKYGLKALDQLNGFIFSGDWLDLPDFITSSFTSVEEFREIASDAMAGAGLHPKQAGQGCRLKRFLNRLFGLPLQLQSHVFDLFSYQLEANVAAAKADNKYSEGIVDICGQTSIECECDLYKCPRTGAVAKYFKISTDRGVSWDDAISKCGEQSDPHAGFYQATYQSAANKDIFVLALKKQTLASTSSMSANYYHLVRPNTGYSPTETHRSDLFKNYAKVSPERARIAWESLYESSGIRCGHVNSQHCAGKSCTFQRRIHHYHIVAGLVLPFWKDIARLNENMKVVRVSAGGKRIVGLNIFPKVVHDVKDIIQQGIAASSRIEERVKDLPSFPFLEPIGEPLLIHDCLSTSGVEMLALNIDSRWNEDVILYARCFEIPLVNAAAAASRLKEVPWQQGPSLFINDSAVQVSAGTGKLIAPLILDRALWQNQKRIELKAISAGTRLFLVIQAARKRSVDEVIIHVRNVGSISRTSCRELLQELKKASESDDIKIVSADSIPLRCPLGFTRIETPVRGVACRHLHCFDLKNFLVFADRSGRLSCPVCDKTLYLDDLRVDVLSQEALGQQSSAESFVIDDDGLVHNGVSKADTPPTARKAGMTAFDTEAVECSKLELGQPIAGDQAMASPEMAQLAQSGVWEYCELAESVFHIRTSSTASSDQGIEDADAGSDEDHDISLHDGDTKVKRPKAGRSSATTAVSASGGDLAGRGMLRRTTRRAAAAVNYCERSDNEEGESLAASQDESSGETSAAAAANSNNGSGSESEECTDSDSAPESIGARRASGRPVGKRALVRPAERTVGTAKRAKSQRTRP